MNWQHPYRDADPTRTDVSRELLPRSLRPQDSREVYDETGLTWERRLEIIAHDVRRQMERIDARIAVWRDPELRTPNPGVRASAIEELERRRAIGVSIMEKLDACAASDDPDAPRSACYDVQWDYNYFLSPL